ncbi:hypothetical protein MLD38_014621 [Melastoma candidum]|uniref:Uncharacterized protein n=1 Tax=Melastoma candidum TaxID=119954 RepID=A0ACB9RF90_9MYRT|nr:hypothetical protein MLD38_014621 [Melastoma candidum]
MLRFQSRRASRIVDAFLADPFEADCAKSTHSSGRQGNCSKSSGLDCEGDTTKGSGDEGADLQHVSPGHSYPDVFSCDGLAVGAQEYQGTGPSFSVRCDVTVGDLPIDDGGDKAGVDPFFDIKEGSPIGAFTSHVQPPRDPFQDPEVNGNPGEDASGSSRLLDDTRHAHREFAQTTTKRRKKASNASDTDGCKRCSCKKSRCLKLYCDCFAAGLFCTEPCACQGCLNRFEEQDTVLAARERIQSRNPQAFAPKIVHSNKTLDATTGEEGIMSTPSSSRHKKGCNCKRSMCQKKYCECYQANVGCSDNCRCEGCQNVFGTKEDFSFARELACRTVDAASLEGTSNVKMAIAGTYSHDHLMPPTPSFQFSDNRKGLQRSRLAIECPCPSSTAKSGAARWSREMQSEVSKESPTLETVTNFIESDFSEKVGKFSSKHYSLGGSSNLAPLSSPTTMKSSSGSTKTEPAHFTIRLGGGHAPSRFLWRGGSLETPGNVSGGENYHLDDNLSGKVYWNLGDDAPGVPKDVPSPPKPVIVSSPNRKRVSSPHKQVQEHHLTPSTALRSGGKFILKAVPSFPPLTPLGEPRNNTSEPHGPP